MYSAWMPYFEWFAPISGSDAALYLCDGREVKREGSASGGAAVHHGVGVHSREGEAGKSRRVVESPGHLRHELGDGGAEQRREDRGA